MRQKKFIHLIIIFVIALWAFCISLVVSSSIARKSGKDNTTTAAGAPSFSQQITTEPQTTADDVTVYMPPDITLGNHVATTVTPDDPAWKVSYDASVSASKQQAEINKNVPVGKDNIVKAYVDGINKAKNTEKLVVSTDGSLDISFDQITGGAAAEKIALEAMQANAPKSVTYNFIKGTDSETGQTTVTAIPPSGSFAKLSSDAVKQATANPTGDGGYKIVIVLKDETQTLTQEAVNHSKAIEALNLTDFLPSGMEMEEMTVTYSGTTAEAVFDKDNRLISLSYKLNIASCSGNGTYNFMTKIPIEFALHGTQTRSCTFTY
ncbi:MAG: hypothetical protein IKJ27_00925 [Clostridia bacterium]|nr:hypothetical protein [Clostridia bacterium]